MAKNTKHKGLSIIEVVLLVVIVCILAALIGLTANGMQAKNRNSDRQGNIATLQMQLENYYAGADTYPTLAQINDPQWRSKNMPKLPDSSLDDPRWQSGGPCTAAKRAILTPQPEANCYAYLVTATDGSTCEDGAVKPCAHYSLIATLEGGEHYLKSSVN